MQKKSIGVWNLTFLNVAAVLSIVNDPAQAQYGYQIVFYLGMSAICFLVPTALVSAEMASALPRDGGLYLWGKEAFSPRVG
ncbi:MAG: amino acid permease, partial [Victivallaceae bacterium]|nr:amino acid permease [Victivallaceae bacterium]